MANKKSFFLKFINAIYHLFGKDKFSLPPVKEVETDNKLFTGPYFYETEIISDYYKSQNKLQDTTEDIFNWVFKTALNKLTNSMLPSQVYDILLKGSQPNYLAEILNTVNEIDRKIDELAHKVTMFKYEDVINARNTRVSQMANAQLEVNEKLYAMSSNVDNVDKIKLALNDWKDTPIGGNKSLTEFLNFIDFIVDNKNDGMSIYEIYDKYVYFSTPWENMGYQFREDIRLADFSVIFSQARLAILYYTYNEENETVKTNMINNIITALKKFETYYNEHKVVRHDNLAICQIDGCKVEMSRDIVIKYYSDMYWFPKDTYWYTPDYQNDTHIPELSGSLYDLVLNPNKLENYHGSFTESEINILKQYYNGKYTNMLDMLRKDAGFNITYNTENAFLLVQVEPTMESESWNNGNWYIKEKAVKINANFNTGWYTIGDAWLQRYGFLWAKRRFKGWDTFYYNNTWFILHINKRLS